MKLYTAALSMLLFLIPVNFVLAKDVPVQGRVFAGATLVKPEDVNTELTARGLKNIDSITQYGVEMLYPVTKYIDVGLRYTKRYVLNDELISSSATDYEAQLDQESVMAMLRIPFFRSSIFRFDGFAGFGGSNTSLQIKTSAYDGSLDRKDTTGWFGSMCSSFGGSVAVGYKRFYFVVEAGVDNNKIEKLTRVGTINSNIDVIDLSGSYFTIGLLFDGVSATRK